MTSLDPSCVWRLSPELIIALDERFGEPTDAYVNGSQVWLRDDGPREAPIEWRLHPVANYRKPPKISPYDLFSDVALALARDETPATAPEQLWDGLEAYPAFDDEVEPAVLAAACESAIGIRPDAAGLVNHTAIGDEWERTNGGVSIIAELLSQLDRS